MELPIVKKYEENILINSKDKIREKIRLLDIDGTYFISIFQIEDKTNRFINYLEFAFDSLWEAEEFLYDELDIDFPSIQQERKDNIEYDPN